MTVKRGRLSADDHRYIEAECENQTADAIAATLNRSLDSIKPLYKKALAKKKRGTYGAKEVKPEDLVSPEEQEKFVIRTELRNSEAWKRLDHEFTPEELKYFEERYVEMLSQFKGDVLATENVQIMQVIRFEILQSRNLYQRREINTDIDNLKTIQRSLSQQYPDPKKMTTEVREQLMKLETAINVARGNEAAKSTEYAKLQERHDKLTQSLKGTRDQRLEKIEKEGIDFVSILKQLSKKDIQDREGRHNELMKLGTQKEYERLGRPHKFQDGNIDSPILSVDTVDLPPLETDETYESEENDAV